jgi:hypothetical protein
MGNVRQLLPWERLVAMELRRDEPAAEAVKRAAARGLRAIADQIEADVLETPGVLTLSVEVQGWDAMVKLKARLKE